MVLCKYGIEYVEDKKTDSKIPTCHRTLYQAILTDVDYLAAFENADAEQKELYVAEAKVIDELQKNILNIVNNEEPFDVFICYKETDDDGKRTVDSSLSNDIYYQLTQEGFKVFYAPITLEDKLGYEYEPYIFAALNSAKIMLVVGTKPEHFDAVWVRNEWSRYLKIMKTDRSKLLIPCYRDMDAYELPDEFAHLQAQDMSKIGFIQDLVRGINKLVSVDNASTVKETVVVESSASGNVNIDPLLRRAFMFLEDGNIKSAREYCEKVLDISPECADAYLVKLMAECHVKNKAELKDCDEPFDNSLNYQKILRFGDNSLVNELKGYLTYIKERNENERLEAIYREANDIMASSKTQKEYEEAEGLFKSISFYKDSEELAKKCRERAEIAIKNAILSNATKCIGDFEHEIIVNYENAILLLNQILGWKNADELIGKCQIKIEQIRINEENERIERERLAEERRLENERNRELQIIAREKANERNRKITIIATPIVGAIVIFAIILNAIIIPNSKYNAAVNLMNECKYQEAILAFEELNGYKDSNSRIEECNVGILDQKYNNAISLMKDEKYENALEVFNEIKELRYCDDKIAECKIGVLDFKYNKAIEQMDSEKNKEALAAFKSFGDYKDSKTKITECEEKIYVKAVTLTDEGKYIEAITDFQEICDYRDSFNYIRSLLENLNAKEVLSAGEGHNVGLKSDGTVVVVGYYAYKGQGEIGNWKDIVAISASSKYTVGLKSDGTVVAVGDNDDGQCDVSDWTDIVAVSAGWNHTVGLKSDGTVVAVGNNKAGQCNVEDWKDIVAISASSNYTIGLKSDGTVVTVGNMYNYNGSGDIEDWKDIVAISAGPYHTVGLKSDGTVIAVGRNIYNECGVENWKLGIKYKITE